DAFAVHDHGACEHQSVDPCASHPGQQNSGAVVVHGRIVRQILHVHAEAYLGGQVANGLHADQCRIHDGGVADVAQDVLVGHLPAHQVEHPHVVAGAEQLRNDLPPDEATASSHQNTHLPHSAGPARCPITTAPSGRCFRTGGDQHQRMNGWEGAVLCHSLATRG